MSRPEDLNHNGTADRANRDRGAATLEYVGVLILVAALVAAAGLVLLTSKPEVPLSRAVCRILSFGQGDCGQGSPTADRLPSQPCVISSDSTTNTLRAGVAVIGQGAERWLIEQLGDGRYRLSRSTGGGAGVTTGAGFDVTFTNNDQDYGFSLGAEANALGVAEEGEVYYVDSRDQAEDFLSKRRWEQGLDDTVGDSGPVRWVADKIRNTEKLPEPDETWVAGGVLGDAKATVDWIAAGAQANADLQYMLGARLRKDGSGTAYYSVNLNGQAAAATWAGDEETGATVLDKAQAAGSVKAQFEIDYDSAGNATALRLRTTLGGSAAAQEREAFSNESDGPSANSYQDRTYELPLNSDQDRQHAAGMASALGIPYVPGLSRQVRSSVVDPGGTVDDVAAFIGDVRDHGRMWEDDYDLNLNTDLGLNVDAEWITGVVVDASSNSAARKSTGQKYFDGTTWREREGCGAS